MLAQSLWILGGLFRTMSVAGLVPGLLQDFAPRWQLREIRLPGSRLPNALGE